MDRLYFLTGQEAMPEAGRLLPPDLSLQWHLWLGSTNELALQGEWPPGTVIAADCQESGRGRLGRVWHSPPGLNLYFSLVYYPSLPAKQWGGFSLAVGASLGQALAPLLPGLRLKWPNDLLLPAGKLGGILLEARGEKVVAGIGINVNQVDFPPLLRAVSLARATGKKWRRDRLLALLAPAALKGLEAWNRGEAAQVLASWRSLDILLGKDVEVRRGEEIIRGRALAISPEGRLLVQEQGGVQHSLASGEVTISR